MMQASFLYTPNYDSLLDGKFHLTTQPLLYQDAGELVSSYVWEELAFCHPLNFENAVRVFRRKLEPDQRVWVVPLGKITDFSSQPKIVDFFIPREAIRFPALLHDDQRPKITTHSNFTSDGGFCDAIQVWAKQIQTRKIGRMKAICAFLAVWYGYVKKMKFGPEMQYVQEARKRWARRNCLDISDVQYFKEYCELKIPQNA